LIEDGEHVKQGQVLAHLDDHQYRAQVEQGEAQVNVAKATLEQLRAQLEQAKRDVKRDNDLVAQKLIPVQAAETQRTQAEMLEAQVKSQERQVELQEAALKGLRVLLDYTIVRAPFTGVITAKAAQPGEIVSPMSAGGGFTRTGVGTIVDMDSLEIEVDVNEAYISRVTPNQPAKATLDAYPDWNIPAHVIAIIPTADRSKATVKVRVAIDQKDPRILPDMGVRVSFESAKSANEPPPKGVLVPASSIVTRDGKSVVFEVDGDRAREHTVNPGLSFGDLKLVQEINAGVHLVRTPPEDLKDGTHVAIKQQE
jgi:RND family efflux transporter MFP subunit